MDDFLRNILDRIDLKLDGPLNMRLIMQPLMALYFAVKSGINDYKTSNVPYLKNFFKDKSRRKIILEEIWRDVGKIFIIAVIIDLIFQLIVFQTVFMFGAISTAVVLAIMPYVIFRGLTGRILKLFNKKAKE